MIVAVELDEYLLEQQVVEQIRGSRHRINEELSKVIVGQADVVEHLLISLFAGGHCLITGAPGLAKTLLVRSIAQIFHLKFQRIQFTPDLMPADITGTEILEQAADGTGGCSSSKARFSANVILADEINRTPPKTQAALLEAMQEHQVTVAGVRYPLEEPFFVLATQNPIEMEGTYPLPEAQLDRFMFNVLIDYLPEDDEVAVVTANDLAAARADRSRCSLATMCGGFTRSCSACRLPKMSIRYAVRLAAASRPGQPNSPSFINDWVSWGAGTRAGQYMVLGAKARALLSGRNHATIDDVRALVHPTLRHRILIGYRAEAEGVSVEHVIDRLLETVPPPGSPA